MTQIKKADLNSCIDLFSEIIFSPNCIQNLKEQSLLGELGNSPLRPMSWKIFLGVLNESQGLDKWIATTFEKRSEYKKLVNKYLGKKKLAGDPLGAMAAAANSGKSQNWNTYYKDNEIKKIINLDLDRTYQEIELFLKKETKTLLGNVLFIWSKENEDVSYKQGMNELLAVIFLAFYPFYFKNNSKKTKDELIQSVKSNPKEKKNEIFAFFFDEAELQADLFAAYDILMKKGIKDFFDTLEAENVNYKKHNLFNNELTSGNEENNAQTPLTYRCFYIINDILKNTDEQLYEHFKKIKLEGNLFLQ